MNFTAYLCIVIDTDATKPTPLYAHTTSEWPATTTRGRQPILLYQAGGKDFEDARRNVLELTKPGAMFNWVRRLPKGLL